MFWRNFTKSALLKKIGCFSTSIRENDLTNYHKRMATVYCKNYLEGAWMTIHPDQIIVEELEGGLSNYLLYCTLPKSVNRVNMEPSEVVVRLFGANIMDSGQKDVKRLITQNVSQNVIFTILSERAYGPKIYGADDGGRVEEFVMGRNLVWEDFPSYITSIGQELSKLHQFSMPLIKNQNWLVQNLRIWHNAMSKIDPNKIKNHEERKIVHKLMGYDYGKEIFWLEKTFFPNIKSPIVFSHNDFHSGNILLLSKEYSHTVKNEKPRIFQNEEQRLEKNSGDNLMVIDFEYCSYNFRAFDIAQHFSEWAYDYTEKRFPFFNYDPSKSPTPEQQDEFLQAYIGLNDGSKCFKSNGINQKEELKKLAEEVNAFKIVPHLFWCLWSIDMATNRDIKFSYWAFAHNRIEKYFEEKAIFLKTVK